MKVAQKLLEWSTPLQSTEWMEAVTEISAGVVEMVDTRQNRRARQGRAGSSPAFRTKQYWYFISCEECVLCGRSRTYRERRYTPKPVDTINRVSFSQFACGSHFM